MKNKLSKFIHGLLYKNHPRESYVYGITEGIYKGTSIIFFDLDNPSDNYNTLAIGDEKEFVGGMRIFTIPKTAVKEGFDNGVIQKIKSIPKWMNNIFRSEYSVRFEAHQNRNTKNDTKNI